MRFNRNFRGRGINSQRTTAQRAIAFLRSLGTSAHVWLPGANGVSVASLPSSNLLLSDGTTGFSTLDSVAGLALDAMGGARPATNHGLITSTSGQYFNTPDSAYVGDLDLQVQVSCADWLAAVLRTLVSKNTPSKSYLFAFLRSGVLVFYGSADGSTYQDNGKSSTASVSFANNTTNWVRVTKNFTTGDIKFYTSSDGSTWTQLGTTLAGAVYTLYDSTGTTDVGGWGPGSCFISSIYRAKIYAGGSLALDFDPTRYVSGTTFTAATGEVWTITGASIVPDGIHLSQPTTNAKPLLRCGLFNALTQSNNFAHANWTKYLLSVTATGIDDPFGGTTAVTLTASGGASYIYQTITSQLAVNALWVRRRTGSGLVRQGSVALGYTALALTGSWQLFVSPAATGVYGGLLQVDATGDAVDVCFAGTFPGAWTAAQILAEGGITTTTATPASNPSAGKYWWSFDGSNDSLLSGNLGITNACTIVMSLRVNNLAATQIIFAEDTNGVQVSIATDGSVSLTKVGGAALVTTAAGVVVAGVPLVLTARLSAGNADIRKSGAQSATAASALTFSAVTGARVGTAFNGTTSPTGGALGWVVPSAVGLSDADCLTVERLAGAQFPGMATF